MNRRITFLVFLVLAAPLPPVAAQEVELVRTIGSLGTGQGQFDFPHNMALDSQGNILVPDFRNDRVQKLNSQGQFIQMWGSAGSGPGQFDGPVGIAVDSDDNVYVVELNNERVQKFDSGGNFVAQWGSPGSGSGQFDAPSGIAVDASDDVWVADRSNHRIQKFNSNGSFIASFGSSGSGNGQFSFPTGIGIAANGDLLIADQGNERIQRFSSSFSFRSKFGSFGSGPGQFDNPSDVAVSDDGRIFVADKDNHRIQVFSSAGAYLGEFGGSGSAPGKLNQPRGIVVEGDQIFVADRNNNRLQQFRDTVMVVVVDEKISGSWFDPSNDGEGWKIEILNDSSAVIYWFTYPPPGLPGAQAWIGGVGRIEGNQIIVDENDSFITSDGVFADRDRSVTLSTWGGFTFTFDGEDSGTMDYQGPAEWGSGSFNIIRLTGVTTAAESMQTNLGKGISGSWIASAGEFANEGWLIEVFDEKKANVYWFTYDENGNQAWNTGVGILVANSILVFNPVDASGTVFGAGFDPADVIRLKWGSYIFTFDDCSNGVITYFNGKGLGTSQIELTRLTFLDGAPCTDFVRTKTIAGAKGEDKPTIGAVCTNPDDPTLLISFRDDGHNGFFFGDKTADGLAQSLDKILIKPIPGAEGQADTVIDIASGDIGMTTGVADVASGNTARLELDPDNDDIVLTGVSQDGGLQSIVNTNLDVLINRQDKRGGSAAAGTAGSDGNPRRASDLKIWSNEYKSLPAQPSPGGARAAVEVVANRCGAPVTNAAVSTVVRSEAGDVLMELAGRQTGDGVYTIPVPTAAASDGPLRSEKDQCGGFTEQAGAACVLFDRLEDRNFPLLCSNTAAGMIEGELSATKLAQATDLFSSCVSALASGKLVCDSAGSQQATGGGDREDYVCSDALAADRKLGVSAQFTTTLSVPGTVIRQQLADSLIYGRDGPFPTYQFTLDGDPLIDDFTTIPSAPDARQGYTAVAKVSCLPANSVVEMTITGSDGVTGSGRCTISGSGECGLVIPAGVNIVRDMIRVTVPGLEREVQILF